MELQRQRQTVGHLVVARRHSGSESCGVVLLIEYILLKLEVQRNMYYPLNTVCLHHDVRVENATAVQGQNLRVGVNSHICWRARQFKNTKIECSNLADLSKLYTALRRINFFFQGTPKTTANCRHLSGCSETLRKRMALMLFELFAPALSSNI